MTDDVPSIMSHVSVGTNDYARAVAFYDKVMATIGAQRIMEHGEAVAYGKQFPEFWVQTPFDGERATIGNGVHFAFLASSQEMACSMPRERTIGVCSRSAVGRVGL